MVQLTKVDIQIIQKIESNKNKALTLLQLESALNAIRPQDIRKEVEFLLKQGVIVSSKNKFDEVIYKKNLARPDASASTVKYKDLAPEAQAVHKAIEEFREKGCNTRQLRTHLSRGESAVQLTPQQLKKHLEFLEKHRLLKQFKAINAPTIQLYCLSKYEPPAHVTGGFWHSNNMEFDSALAEAARNVCWAFVRKRTFRLDDNDHSTTSHPLITVSKRKPPSAQDLLDHVLSTKIIPNIELSNIMEVMRSLELDGMVEKIKPTGTINLAKDGDDEPGPSKRRKIRAGSDDGSDDPDHVESLKGIAQNMVKKRMMNALKEKKREDWERGKKKRERERARSKAKTKAKAKEKKNGDGRGKKRKAESSEDEPMDSDDQLRTVDDPKLDRDSGRNKSKKKRGRYGDDSESESESDSARSSDNLDNDNDDDDDKDDDSDEDEDDDDGKFNSDVESEDLDEVELARQVSKQLDKLKSKAADESRNKRKRDAKRERDLLKQDEDEEYGGGGGGGGGYSYANGDGEGEGEGDGPKGPAGLQDLSDTAVAWRAVGRVVRRLGLTEAPCGLCPVATFCTEGGPVNAGECEYFDPWLDGTRGGWEGETARKMEAARRARREEEESERRAEGGF